MKLQASIKLGLGLPVLLATAGVVFIGPGMRESRSLREAIDAEKIRATTPLEQMESLRAQADALQAARQYAKTRTRPIAPRNSDAAVLGALSSFCDAIGVPRRSSRAAGTREQDGVRINDFELIMDASYPQIVAILEHLDEAEQLIIVREVRVMLPRGTEPGAEILTAEIKISIPHEPSERPAMASAREDAQ